MADLPFHPSRRAMVAGAAVALGAGGAGRVSAQSLGATPVLDPIRTELVMNLVVTCSNPEKMGPTDQATDGRRGDFWPIIGGRFEGPNIRGEVVPGGADFPVIRPDGARVIDAFYRLKTDDGVVIIIHNKGLQVGDGKFRLAPTFIVTAGKYDWLSKGVFVCTLILGSAMPPGLRLAKGPNENDRLLQVHRIT